MDSGAQDVDIIEKARRDPAAFVEIYRRYFNPIYRYLLARVGDRGAAEELTAQVFLAALEGLSRLRAGSNLPAWLFTIARRRAADHYRQIRRESPLFEETETSPDYDVLLQDVIIDETNARLAELIKVLPEHEQELLRLRFASGLPFAEIAILLGRTESGVKMALYRLLERLQRQMNEGDYGE
jgi:RNA polymerase sigma-70 factor (ECF subfamily)